MEAPAIADTRNPAASHNIGPASSSGTGAWSVLDRVVRRIDEEKIKDCKEEMDSLLVFAGLYSAVLTAFLIESYKNLQVDPQATMISLLQRIADQTSSYRANEGYVNSTAVFAQSSPTFHAAVPDIRVNVCWFASLVLSLGTASYSILVKQWLREYLAIGRITPQERLRIRHLRLRGLEDWRLYDIAAALPLFLQVSLALFFTGLCFFTATVHRSIGDTCLYLVSGWAMLFIFALFAPVTSPRCPYKTTFLKDALARLRFQTRQIISYAFGLHRRIILFMKLHLIFNRLCGFFEHIPVAVATVGVSLWLRYLGRIRNSPTGAGDQPQVDQVISHDDSTIDHMPLVFQEPFKTMKARVDTAVLLSILVDQQEERPPILEEEDARQTDEYDVHIFGAMDLALLDDDLLRTMRAALQQKPFSGEATMKLTFDMIRRRINLSNGAAKRARSPNQSLDLRLLSHVTCTSLADIIADRLLYEAESTSPETWYQSDWIVRSLLLLVALSPLDAASTAKVFQKLLFLSSEPFPNGCALLAIYVADSPELNAEGHGLSRVLAVINHSLISHSNSEAAAYAFKYLVHWHCIQEDRKISDDVETFHAFLQATDKNSYCRKVSRTTLCVMMESAGSILHANIYNVDAMNSVYSPQGPVLELIEFILEGLPIIEKLFSFYDFAQAHTSRSVTFDKIFTKLFTTPVLVAPFLECLSKHSGFIDTKTCQIFLLDYICSHYLPDEQVVSILKACSAFFVSKAEQTSAPSSLSLLSTLRLLKLIYTFGTASTNEIIKAWQNLFTSISSVIRGLLAADQLLSQEATESAAANETTSSVAYDILAHIDGEHRCEIPEIYSEGKLASEDANFLHWSAVFKHEGTQCTDEMITLLSKITHSVVDEEGRTFWRIRRLKEQSTVQATA